MQIQGPHQIHGPHSIQAPHGPQQSGAARATSLPATSDQLDISPAAQAALQAAEGGSIRQELVDRIRAEIASGTYETPEKLDVALDRLLDEIG